MSIEPATTFVGTLQGGLELLAPRAADVNIGDVIWSLSRQRRYNGNTKRDWTVAQHSLLCLDIVLEDLLDDDGGLSPRGAERALMTLWHDAAEAYLGDIILPVKKVLGRAYRELETTVQDACDIALTGRIRTAADDRWQRSYDRLSRAVERAELCDAWEDVSDIASPEMIDYARARLHAYLGMDADTVRKDMLDQHVRLWDNFIHPNERSNLDD